MEQSMMDRAETRTGLYVAGEARQTDDVFPVFDPADPETVVGHAPFGGFNQSGFGREMGVEGILAFTDTHSTSVSA